MANVFADIGRANIRPSINDFYNAYVQQAKAPYDVAMQQQQLGMQQQQLQMQQAQAARQQQEHEIKMQAANQLYPLEFFGINTKNPTKAQGMYINLLRDSGLSEYSPDGSQMGIRGFNHDKITALLEKNPKFVGGMIRATLPDIRDEILKATDPNEKAMLNEKYNAILKSAMDVEGQLPKTALRPIVTQQGVPGRPDQRQTVIMDPLTDEIRYIGPPTNIGSMGAFGSPLSKEEISALADMYEEGRLPQGYWSARDQRTKYAVTLEAERRARARGQKIDVGKLEASKKMEANPQIMRSIKGINSVQKLYTELIEEHKKLNLGFNPVLNKAKIVALEQAGDPRVSKIRAIQNSLVQEMQFALMGSSSPSDYRIKLEEPIYDISKGHEAFVAGIHGANSVLDARAEELKGYTYEWLTSQGGGVSARDVGEAFNHLGYKSYGRATSPAQQAPPAQGTPVPQAGAPAVIPPMPGETKDAYLRRIGVRK